MRPIRLEIEGFTAFRNKTTVEFDGVDTFVLSGPTGSGKSSVIDAITFALYGSVPRYNDTKLVHPIISQGLMEAKVRFDFQVGGTNYTAVRIVKKQKKGESWGATTKEARLECGDKVLAGTATELDQKIETLFGLDFDQFTSCVVLPQGEFAKFLNSQPNKRQDLLKSLLRLQIYEQIGSEARRREKDATSTRRVYEEQHLEYADLESADKKSIAAGITRLERLLKEAESLQKDLTKLNSVLSKGVEALDSNKSQIDLLGKVTPPKDYASVSDTHAKLASTHEASIKKVSQLEGEVEKIEKKIESLRDISELQELLDSYDEKNEEENIIADLQKDLLRVEKLEKQHSELVGKLTKQREVADKELKMVQDEHLAYHLSKNLSKGQMCPVCARPLSDKPQHSAPKELKRKETAVSDIAESLTTAQSELQSAKSEKVSLTKQITNSKKTIEQLERSLQKTLSLAQVRNGIQAFEQAKESLEQARSLEKKARKEEKEASSDVAMLSQQLKQRWRALDDVRDSVSNLKPPSVDKENYKKAWDDLTKWATLKRKELSVERAKIETEISDLEHKIEIAFEPIETKLLNEEIEINSSDNVRDVISDNILEARSELKTIDEGLNKLKDLNTKIGILKKTIETAKALAQHMSASYFERWLLQEAFDNLVTEASKKLSDLTSGDYSFAIDDKLNFDVIDHKNADEKRTSKTLSGGETFLASLALALTLSEQIAQLATEGSAPLESIFLDEGFGTLDPETLDTVATAIEELASKGRMIGLITHMKELAERIPVQYRVSKGNTTATIERVSL
jgi:exonuclease SbcC